MRVSCRRVLALLFGLLACLPLSAHQLKVFATAEGDKIMGQVYFVGGAKASGATILISDADGRELARLKPHPEGDFSYPVERRADHLVVADSGDGHLASWRLRADEFSPKLPGTATADSDVNGASSAAGRAQQAPVAIQSEEQSDLADQIERAVARQVRPLREALQAYEERVRLRDILGGIGYIVGLAGLALWWRGCRRDNNR